MTREEFNRAFTVVISMEFANVPMQESEIDVVFSPNFLKKMDTLISMQQGSILKIVSVMRRRIAILVIVIVGLLVTSCGIIQVTKYMHHDIYLEVKSEFLENGGELDLNAEFHDMTYVPEGFEKSSLDNQETSKIVKYSNERGHWISFLQDKAGDSYSILAEESVTRETITIDGKKVEVFKNYELIGAMWIEDGVYMEIIFHAGNDMDELKAMIESVE